MVTIVNLRPVYPSGGVSYPDLEIVKKAIEKGMEMIAAA
jgi:hypothetical protein